MICDLQLDSSNSSTVVANNCEFIDCKGKTAIHVHDNSTMTLEKCKVSNSTEIGVISTANLKINQSQVINSGKIGVYLSGQSNSTIQESIIQSNGDCGVYASNGKCNCISNRITSHRFVGIKIGINAAVEVRENSVSNNGLMTVERE